MILGEKIIVSAENSWHRLKCKLADRKVDRKANRNVYWALVLLEIIRFRKIEGWGSQWLKCFYWLKSYKLRGK